MLPKKYEFDVVIPVHERDKPILEHCINGVRKNLIGVRRIITVSKEKYTQNAEWIDEAIFPFSYDLVKSYKANKAGWFFQQLLKMYSPIVIPDILPNVMVLDSDTVFFRRIPMFDKKGRAFYNLSKGQRKECQTFTASVDAHIEELLPAIKRKNIPPHFKLLSAISHNMIFNREIMKELFEMVEALDVDKDPFYKIFLKNHGQGVASEYQIYFNFMMVFHPDLIVIRKLKFKNTSDPDITKYSIFPKYHFCSFHHYLRGTKQKSLRNKLREYFYKIIKILFVKNPVP